jgi:hypothetical protein
MISKIVICVTSRQATVGVWRLKRVQSCAAFANDVSGHAEFGRFLQQHPNVPVYLIVDTVEEDFRLETLPHATGGARQEMVERKLNQLYRSTTYRTAQFVGREPDKRRDDRFLLMSLTNPEIIAPWLAVLEELHAPLAGVYLQPSVSQLLIKTLKLKTPDLLLMTKGSAGLRQSYFSGANLRISRLTPLNGMDEHQVEQFYVNETEKTRLYLISLRVITRESRLQLVFPAIEPVHEDFCRRMESSQSVDCELIAPEQLARRCGLDIALLQQYPDLLHMHALALNRPQGNLASDKLVRHFQIYKLRMGINLASALCVFVASAIVGSNLLATASLGRQLSQAADETRRQESLYNAVAQNFPKTALPGSELKSAVETADALQKINRTPQRMMLVVSSALDAQPEIVLNRMRWKLTEDPNARDDEEKGTASANAAPSAPLQAGNHYEIGYVDGEIASFDGDYRAALESVNRFVEKLKLDKAVEQVSILQQPVNTSSLVNLKGSTLDEQTQQLPAANFKVKLILKPVASS